MFIVRQAKLEDASAIATVHVAAWREAYRGIVSDEFLANLSIQRRTEQWVNLLSNDSNLDRHAFVAEMNEQIVGFASCGAANDQNAGFDGELNAIYILRAANKLGVGRRLVYEVVNAMIAQGRNSMMVWVLKENPARGFYERLGGEYLLEKPIAIGSETLMEVAYGWRDLSRFQGGQGSQH